ncbi:MAG: DNA alkylation repair protein [Lachnospiraceae bacterium]|nr:DNA alkylation repair protein [Lachnospiraceae bacterium]
MEMNTIVSEAVNGIKILSENIPDGSHIITGDIRKLAARLYKSIEDKSIENVLCLCEELLEEHSWAFGVIAFDWAYRVRNQYSEATYDIFYSWLKKYVRGWGDCEDFWVRRASAVILIPAILHNDYEGINPLSISDLLMKDEHDLVQKGYGWMLKSLSQVDMEAVKDYLVLNHAQMPRTAYRYALEKFDKETRNKLMNL